MKIKSKILITVLFVSIIACNTSLKAAMVTKPASNLWSVDISTAYQLCYDLRISDSTLGDNNLDPHLVLPNDWDSVEILAKSTYGETSYSNVSFVQGEMKYYSSTQNKSGVFFEQKGSYGVLEHAAALFNEYNYSTDTNKSYRVNLYNNKDTKYVQSVDKSIPTSGIMTNSYATVGIGSTSFDRERKATLGKSDTYTTFRPAIWNK